MIRVYRERLNHGFWHRDSIRALFLIAALSGFSLNSAAVDWVTQARGQALWNAAVHGRTTNIGVGPGAMITVKPLNSGPFMPAGNYGVAPGVNGGVAVGGAATVAVAGAQVPVQISGTIGKEVVAGAISGCLTGSIVGCAIGTLTPIAIGWIASSGIEKDPAGSGSWGTKGTVGEIWYYSPTNTEGSTPGSVAAKVSGKDDCYLREEVNPYTQVWGCPGFGGVTVQKKESPSGTWNPLTPEGIKNALIKAGAPPPMIVTEVEPNGVNWNAYAGGAAAGAGSLGLPNITGPSSVSGNTTTTTNSDGTTTTTTTSTPLTYGPGTVTAGPPSTTTRTTNPDGSTRSTSTTTTTGPDGGAPTTTQGEEEAKDPCEGHPDRVGCLDIDVPEGKIPKDTKTITFTPEQFGSDGRCPADVSMSFRTMPGIGSAKIIDWASFCNMALPMRAIVLALASFMAFFIVMPGSRVE